MKLTSEATLTPFDNFDISVTGAFTRKAGRVMVSGAVKNAPSVAGTELLENNFDAYLSLDAYHIKSIFLKIILISGLPMSKPSERFCCWRT